LTDISPNYKSHRRSKKWSKLPCYGDFIRKKKGGQFFEIIIVKHILWTLGWILFYRVSVKKRNAVSSPKTAF